MHSPRLRRRVRVTMTRGDAGPRPSDTLRYTLLGGVVEERDAPLLERGDCLALSPSGADRATASPSPSEGSGANKATASPSPSEGEGGGEGEKLRRRPSRHAGELHPANPGACHVVESPLTPTLSPGAAAAAWGEREQARLSAHEPSPPGGHP